MHNVLKHFKESTAKYDQMQEYSFKTFTSFLIGPIRRARNEFRVRGPDQYL